MSISGLCATCGLSLYTSDTIKARLFGNTWVMWHPTCAAPPIPPSDTDSNEDQGGR